MPRKTILIADDDAALVQVVSKRCEAHGLNVKRAYGVFNALSLVRADAPDLVCCDVNMPDGNGLAACEILATSSDWSGIPRIILTARQDEATINRCRDLGARYVLKSENVWPTLESVIDELLDGRAAANHDGHLTNARLVAEEVQTLIVIDNDVTTVRAIDAIVAPRGLVVLHYEGLREMTHELATASGVLCEFDLHSLPGPVVVSELRKLGYRGPIIMMSRDNSQRALIESVSAGVNGFLAKPFSTEKLIEALRRHTGFESNRHLKAHAFA